MSERGSNDKEIPEKDANATRTLAVDIGDGNTSDVDGAWKFLDNHRGDDASTDIKALRRKIDWHIVPLMFLCYTMQFLDKVIYNVSLVLSSTFACVWIITWCG